MKNIVFILALAIVTFFGCKKDNPGDRTGIQLSIDGPREYYMEVVVGTPVEPITDVDKWRPDVHMWALVSDGYKVIPAGTYTILLKNIQTQKIISVPVVVTQNELTTIKAAL